MSQGFAPFYDVNRTYEDNYLQGPFGAFAEVLKSDADADASEQSTQSQPFDQAEEFLGFRVNLPFGIPAGPLLNERFTTAAFRMGFDLAVYKTVRSRAWGCNAFPSGSRICKRRLRRPAMASCWCRAFRDPALKAWIARRTLPIMSPPRIW